MSHPKRAITRAIRTRRPKRVGREAAELEALAWPETAIRVRDVMTRPAVIFREEMTVGAAVKAMRTRKIRHAPVVGAKGALAGIVTDRDLRQAVLEPALAEEMQSLSQALATRTVKEIMTWDPVTVKPETEIREAARLMHSNKIGALPVIQNGRVVGIVTGSDVLKALIQILDEGMLSKPGRWSTGG
jgi:acetoin utilization protein AcuB